MKRTDRYKRRKRAERSAGLILTGLMLAMGLSLFFYIRGRSEERQGRIGNVDFTVTEPLGDEELKNKGTLVGEPGQILSKDPTIQLERHSSPAYLRAKIFYGGLNSFEQRAVEAGLSIKTGWRKNPTDGYYYYQYVVQGGEQIPFFYSVKIPEMFGKSGGKIRFCLEVYIEAAETECIRVKRDEKQKIQGWTSLS